MEFRTVLGIAFAVVADLPARAQDEEHAPPTRLGIYERTMAGLVSPSALASTAGGELLVAESDSGLVSVWSAAGERVREIGAGTLLDPRGIAVLGERVFVADAGKHTVFVFTLEGAKLGSFGGYGVEPGQLRDPRGIAATESALYVCDTGNDRVQKLSLDGAPLASAGTRGSGKDELLRPSDVAVAPDGSVFVTDTGNHRVQRLDAELRFVASFGDFGPHPGFFAYPEGVEVLGGDLYVVDTDNHRVQVFGSGGERIYEWGLHALLPREGDGKLHYPTAIAMLAGADGPRAAVAEPYEDRIQVFRPTRDEETVVENRPGERVVAAHFGQHVSTAGDLIALSEPSAPSLLLYDVDYEIAPTQPWEPIQITRMAMWGRRFGELLDPNDVEIDWGRKILYVADADAGRISAYRFHHDEKRELGFDFYLLDLVRSICLDALHRLGQSTAPLPIRPSALELRPGGDLWVLDSLQRIVLVLSPEFEPRSIEGPYRAWKRPIDLAFSPDGARAYVADELGATVHLVVIDPSQVPLEPFRFEPREPLQRPAGIAVAPDGTFFVSDRARARVHAFDSFGRELEAFGAPGLGPLEFHKPAGLDVDAKSRLWIVDWGNHRGQVRGPDGSFVVAFGSRWFVRPTMRPR
jgi:tripartite motif-containing protein 71